MRFMNQSRSGHAACVLSYNNQYVDVLYSIVVAGGFNSKPLSVVEEYIVDRNEWIKRPQLTSHKYGHSLYSLHI